MNTKVSNKKILPRLMVASTAMAIALLAIPAFAASNIDTGIGGTTTAAGTADTVTITATAGTTVTNGFTVSGTTTTNGITNTGAVGTGSLSTTGAATIGTTLGVTGATTTNGITNTGAVATGSLSTTAGATVGTTLGVTGATTTNGITNTGAVATGSLSTTAGATVGTTLGVTGASTFHGATFSGNQVHGVAAGTAATDAVNFSQLTAQSAQINGVDHDLRGGVASAIAMGSVPQVDAGKRFSLGIGLGSFKGEQGFAAGGSFRASDSVVLKASVGYDTTHDAAVGLGGAYSW